MCNTYTFYYLIKKYIFFYDSLTSGKYAAVFIQPSLIIIIHIYITYKIRYIQNCFYPDLLLCPFKSFRTNKLMLVKFEKLINLINEN